MYNRSSDLSAAARYNRSSDLSAAARIAADTYRPGFAHANKNLDCFSESMAAENLWVQKICRLVVPYIKGEDRKPLAEAFQALGRQQEAVDEMGQKILGDFRKQEADLQALLKRVEQAKVNGRKYPEGQGAAAAASAPVVNGTGHLKSLKSLEGLVEKLEQERRLLEQEQSLFACFSPQIALEAAERQRLFTSISTEFVRVAQDVKSLSQQLCESQLARKELSDELAHLKPLGESEKQQFEAELAKAKAEMKQLRDQLESKSRPSREEGKLKAENKVLSEKYEKLEKNYDRISRELQSLRQSMQAKAARPSLTSGEHSELNQKTAQIQELQAALEREKRASSHFKGENTRLQEHLAQLNVEVAAAQEQKRNAQSGREEAERALAVKDKELITAVQERSSAKEQLGHLNRAHQRTTEQLRTAQSEREKIKRENNQLQSGLTGSQRDHQETKENLARLVLRWEDLLRLKAQSSGAVTRPVPLPSGWPRPKLHASTNTE